MTRHEFESAITASAGADYLRAALAPFAAYASQSVRAGEFVICIPHDDDFARCLAAESGAAVTAAENARGFVFGYRVAFQSAAAARRYREDVTA